MKTYIKLTDISYRIKSKTILQDISFEIKEGDSFALIGSNGSGKTTLIEIILKDLYQTTGEIFINENPNYNLDSVGVLYDKMPNLPSLKVKELIKLFSIINNIKFESVRKNYYSALELDSIENSFFRELSQGERKRIGLLIAIIRDPSLLIMDEPFANLDPIIIERIWSILKSKRRTIVFSTHNWKEASIIANKIAFIYSGRLLNQPQSADSILNSMPAKQVITTNFESHIVDNVTNLRYYVHNGKINIFFNKENDYDIIRLVNEYSSNYYVKEVDLMDAYIYLSNNQ